MFQMILTVFELSGVYGCDEWQAHATKWAALCYCPEKCVDLAKNLKSFSWFQASSSVSWTKPTFKRCHRRFLNCFPPFESEHAEKTFSLRDVRARHWVSMPANTQTLQRHQLVNFPSVWSPFDPPPEKNDLSTDWKWRYGNRNLIQRSN